MLNFQKNMAQVMIRIFVVFFITACGSSLPQPEGDWTPVNRYEKEVKVIPLNRPYKYVVMPIDATLKNVLERWAADSGLRLRYDYHSDFSLTEEVKGVKAYKLTEGINALNQIYGADSDAVITLGAGMITVREVKGARQPKKKNN